MNLQIRDPRAHQLASRLAALRNTSLTQAVIDALETAVAQQDRRETVNETVARLHRKYLGGRKPQGRNCTKEELDDLWGHPPDDLG